MNKRICGAAVLCLALALSACGRPPVAAPEEATPAAQESPAADAMALETADVQAWEQLLLEASADPSEFFQTPCIEAPYDYEYVGEEKEIVIRRFEHSSIVYFVADVQLADVSHFRTALSEGGLEALSTIAARHGAVLAVNADDYGVHKYGIILRNGMLLRAQETTRHMLAVDADGNLHVYTDRAGEDPEQTGLELVEGQTWQTFEFGPALIQDGQAVEFGPEFDLISTAPDRREPRTAIGQIGPLHYVIIVADGRQSGYSRGMTLTELQQLFLRFGAQTAINLDGGGSSELWFQGEVINRPSEGRERRLSDIIYF